MINKYLHIDNNRNFSIATIWINGGSKMDSHKKKGINHILCSLLTRGCEGFDNLSLSDFIENYGGELNHEVVEDSMSISIKCLNSHFDRLYRLLDLIINKPSLKEIDFDKVKKSTFNLIKKEKENLFNSGFEKWRKIVYSRHPYAFNSIGYKKDVSEISYKDVLFEYEKFKTREKYLITNNSKLDENFLTVPDQKIPLEVINPNFSLNQKNRCVISDNKSDQIIIMMGNQTCSRKNSEYLPLKLLESYLSYGMSSILFKKFRERNGITYESGVFNPIRIENAPFLVYLSVSNKNGILAFKMLSELWKQLLFSLVDNEELHLAKEKLKSSFLLSNQTLEEILYRKIQLISFGISPYLKKEYFSRIEDISPQVIKDIFNKYFTKPFLSITGDKKICNEIKENFLTNF